MRTPFKRQKARARDGAGVGRSGGGGAGPHVAVEPSLCTSAAPPVPSRDDVLEPAVQARTVIAVRTARGRIGGAKLVHERKRCLADRGDGRLRWCRFGGRESGT